MTSKQLKQKLNGIIGQGPPKAGKYKSTKTNIQKFNQTNICFELLC
jgi:hypothetical protein